MKAMLRTITKILKRERGFTLVEMVTVVAIMGVMAAVAVPMVNSQLGKTRATSYEQDQAMIQTAVDSFFTAADNVRFLGQRQFPILGASNSEATNANITKSGQVLPFNATSTSALISSPNNPRAGTQGGEPKWRDGGSAKDSNRKLDTDGERDYTSAGEEGLNSESRTVANNGSGDSTDGGWYVDKVKFQGQFFAVDTRDYFIDFKLLVDAGFLQQVPKSASPDNGFGTTSGSYSWYVKASGEVESNFYFLPSNSEAFVDPDQDPVPEPADDGTLDVRGFFEGVYP